MTVFICIATGAAMCELTLGVMHVWYVISTVGVLMLECLMQIIAVKSTCSK